MVWAALRAGGGGGLGMFMHRLPTRGFIVPITFSRVLLTSFHKLLCSKFALSRRFRGILSPLLLSMFCLPCSCAECVSKHSNSVHSKQLLASPFLFFVFLSTSSDNFSCRQKQELLAYFFWFQPQTQPTLSRLCSSLSD